MENQKIIEFCREQIAKLEKKYATNTHLHSSDDIAQLTGEINGYLQVIRKLKKKEKPSRKTEYEQYNFIIATVGAYFKWDLAKTLLWMTTPNLHLGGSAPNTLIQKNRTRKVYQFIKVAKEENMPPKDLNEKK